MKRLRRRRDVFYRISGRLGVWPRRLAALTCLLLALLAFVDGRAPTAAQRSVAVVVAAHDLAAGRVLTRSDVRVVTWPAGVAPAAVFHSPTQAVGSVVAGAMTSGEPVTATRLQGRGLAVGLPSGQVAMAVDLADSGSAQLIQAGDLVDLLAGPGADEIGTIRSPHVIATAVRVLAVLPQSGPSNGRVNESTRLIVAVDTATAIRLAGSSNSQIVATLRPST